MRAGSGPDSMIDRRYAHIGTLTAAVAQSAAVQQPVATRTRSDLTSPWAVRTPMTRSPSRSSAVAAAPSTR